MPAPPKWTVEGVEYAGEIYATHYDVAVCDLDAALRRMIVKLLDEFTFHTGDVPVDLARLAGTTRMLDRLKGKLPWSCVRQKEVDERREFVERATKAGWVVEEIAVPARPRAGAAATHGGKPSKKARFTHQLSGRVFEP